MEEFSANINIALYYINTYRQYSTHVDVIHLQI